MKPRVKEKNLQPDSEGSARSRKSPRGKHQKAKQKEMAIKTETSDEIDSVAQIRSKKSKRLEDQMAKMAKELKELKKGKH